MNENIIVKVYDFYKPLTEKIDSIIYNCIRDCHDKYFHTFDQICEYDLYFKKIGNNETVNFTISDKSMATYELNKKFNNCTRKRLYIQSNKKTNNKNL